MSEIIHTTRCLRPWRSREAHPGPLNQGNCANPPKPKASSWRPGPGPRRGTRQNATSSAEFVAGVKTASTPRGRKPAGCLQHSTAAQSATAMAGATADALLAALHEAQKRRNRGISRTNRIALKDYLVAIRSTATVS